MATWRVFKKEPHRRRFTITGKDHMGVTRQMPAYTREDLSYDLARHVGTLVEYRQQNMAVPPMLATWLEGLAPDTKRRLIDFGLVDAQARPVGEHLDDFEAYLTAKGNTAGHVRVTVFRIRSILNGCRIVYWSDVQGSKVQRFISTVKVSKTQTASAQTQNYYLRDFKAFCRWAVADGRLNQSPVEYLRPHSASKVRNDRRHERRALSVEDATKLLNKTSVGPARYGMPASERSILYRLAIETGLRASELRSLTRASFQLNAQDPTVTVQAAYTKNRQLAELPLRPETAALLKTHLANKMPAASAFTMPSKYRLIDMLRADLKVAGIPYRLDPAHGKVVDFHSLRHTCGSWLAAAGVHPKVIQRIMRHSTITLTMDRYTHAFRGDEAAAIAKLPQISADTSSQATGA